MISVMRSRILANLKWLLPLALGLCVPSFVFKAAAEPYNFQGRNFCLTEDARLMTAEGAPSANSVTNSPKSFRFTFGPVKDKGMYAAEVEGSDLPILNGLYYSTEETPGLLAKEYNVGFAWALMFTGELNFLFSAFAEDGTTPVWLAISAQCYKSDG